MPIKIYDPAHKAAILLMALYSIAFGGGMVYCLVKGVTSSTPFEVIFWLLMMMLCAIAMCYPLLRSLLPLLVEKLLSAFFLPTEKIKEPVEQLSRIQGLLNTLDYEQAEMALLEITRRNPRCNTAFFMLANLYFDAYHDREAGLALLEEFFQGKPAIREENIAQILRYCDECEAAGSPQRALPVLRQEIKRNYAAAEKRLLGGRCTALES